MDVWFILSVEKVSLFMNVPNPIITNLAVGKLYILFSFVSIYRNQTNFDSRKFKKKNWDFTSTYIFPFSTYYNWIIQDSIVYTVYIRELFFHIICKSMYNVPNNECLVEREILLYFDRRVVSFRQEKKIYFIEIVCGWWDSLDEVFFLKKKCCGQFFFRISFIIFN